MKIYLGLLNCDWWYTVTLVYSQVLSVPAGDGGSLVRQAPRASFTVSIILIGGRLTLPCVHKDIRLLADAVDKAAMEEVVEKVSEDVIDALEGEKTYREMIEDGKEDLKLLGEAVDGE